MVMGFGGRIPRAPQAEEGDRRERGLRNDLDEISPVDLLVLQIAHLPSPSNVEIAHDDFRRRGEPCQSPRNVILEVITHLLLCIKTGEQVKYSGGRYYQACPEQVPSQDPLHVPSHLPVQPPSQVRLQDPSHETKQASLHDPRHSPSQPRQPPSQVKTQLFGSLEGLGSEFWLFLSG
jgi:hypothetical protein